MNLPYDVLQALTAAHDLLLMDRRYAGGRIHRMITTALEKPRDKVEVVIRWVPGDISSLRPEWSDEECSDFLENNARSIQDLSIGYGWEVIHYLLPEEDE